MQKRWKISSIPVNRCERLPSLRQPKGYVCILHDLKTGNHLIESADLPKSLIKFWRNKSAKRYRLVRILRTDEAVGLKKHLHQRYKKSWIRNHRGWFRLDSAQLRDLDQFIARCSRHIDVSSEQLERWNLKYFAGGFYKHLPKQRLPSGYVYVLKDHYTEDYKIGYTSHPLKRIKYLEEKASGDVEYVHILQSERVKETEAFLHKRFQSCRTRPYKDWEWFRLDESRLQEIQNLAKQRPRARQAPVDGQSSESAVLPAQQAPSAHSAFSKPATQVSPDTQPSKMQLADSRQTLRARRMLAYFLAVVLILVAAILVYAQFATDVFGLG
ncbi:MAG: GIY-YIG nuclease family protein [Chloroflexota bacterium]|nr:GIY-YIG nuclease family protein [Chloroflexota bacterium]